MLEAELPVFAGAQAAFRRAVRCRRGAARPLAGGELRGKGAGVFRLDPNPVEQRRMRSHHEIMRAYGGVVQDLTAGKSARGAGTPNVLLLPIRARLDRG